MSFQYKSNNELMQVAHVRALKFITSRYQLDESQLCDLCAVPIKWTRGRRCRFLHGGRGYSGYRSSGPYIQITLQDRRWHLYERKTIGKTTPPAGVVLPKLLLVTLGLIHEYTHAIQFGVCGDDARPMSEVETTQNEIDYVTQVAPYYLDRLINT